MPELTPPEDYEGSLPEYYIEWALSKLIPNQFNSEVSKLGGRQSKGGAVIDFEIPHLRIAIEVEGEYWHSGFDANVSDELQHAMLESEGWTVVVIKEEDALRAPMFYASEALKGISHSLSLSITCSKEKHTHTFAPARPKRT